MRTAIVVAALAAAAAGTAFADERFPVKPLRFVVGQSPGGATDIVARLVAAKMTEILGQNVVVENRTGAAGSIGASSVAKSPPDGYTILVVSSSFAINPSLYAKLPFDPQKDFAPVSWLAEAPFLLVAHPSLPVKSVKDLIALAKTSPEPLTFGSGGNGSSGHLAGALFESGAGIKLIHVPYKGAGQSLVDVLSGQITFMFASVLSSMPHVKRERLRVLAVTSAKRATALPEVPTIAETAIKGYATTTWYGLLAPDTTPHAVVDRLSAAANKSVMAPDVRERILTDGAEPIGSTPDGFRKHLAAEIEKWRRVVKAAGVTIR